MQDVRRSDRINKGIPPLRYRNIVMPLTHSPVGSPQGQGAGGGVAANGTNSTNTDGAENVSANAQVDGVGAPNAASSVNAEGAANIATNEDLSGINVSQGKDQTAMMTAMLKQVASQMQQDMIAAFRQIVVETRSAQLSANQPQVTQQDLLQVSAHHSVPLLDISPPEQSAHSLTLPHTIPPQTTLPHTIFPHNISSHPANISSTQSPHVTWSHMPNTASAHNYWPQNTTFMPQPVANAQSYANYGGMQNGTAHGSNTFVEVHNSSGAMREQQIITDTRIASGVTSPQNLLDVPCSNSYDAQRNLPSYSGVGSQYSKTIDLPKFTGDPIDWPIFERTFIDTTAEFNYSNTRNIIRLRQALSGKAKEAVDSLLPFPESVPEVIAVLKQNFGRPEQLINRHIATVRKMSSIQYGNYGALIAFSNLVRNLAGFIKYAKADYRICDATLITELVAKLPSEVQMQWAEYKEGRNAFATVVDLSDFLGILAKRANSVQDSLPSTYQGYSRAGANNLSNAGHGYSRANVNNNANQGALKQPNKNHAFIASVEKPDCKICSGSCSRVSSCPAFQKMSVQSRWEKVKEHQLCFGCLRKGHNITKCYSKKKCTVSACTKQHHSMLHMERENPPVNIEDSVQVYRAKTQQSNSAVLFQILPVVITVGAQSRKTFAFIDHGASHSMIEWSLAESLGLQGKNRRLNMQWLGNVTSNQPSQKVGFQIIGCDSFCKPHRMNDVYTVRNLNLPEQSASVKKVKYTNAKPELVIGLDHAHLTTAICTPVMNEIEQPITAKTKLGFVAYGKVSATYLNNEDNAEHVFAAYCTKRKLQDMEQLMKDYYTDDNLGVYPPKEKLMSSDDQRAIRMMEKSTKRIDERYETGLLWKSEDIVFPKSRDMAMSRLQGIEKKMRSNCEFASQYKEKIEAYLEKGYARKLSDEELRELSPKDLYLSHFAVSNPNKKSLRIVFDAAAEVQGCSLNSMLLAGPDLNQSLLSVLLKFRQAPVAVCADIKEMFLQIAINKDDQAAQKFLWRTNTSNAKVDTYVMSRMLFGAKCSPTLAQYVKNANAKRHENCCARAVDGIVNKHYVDDYIDCFSNEDEAVAVIKQVIAIHKEGGFEIRGFVSNSEQVLEKIGGSQPSSDSVAVNGGETERVLGMFWNYALDNFIFLLKFNKVRIEVQQQIRKPTKREVLCLIMSVFDPFGFLGNYMITGKLIMQELWKMGVMRDEVIQDDLFDKWKSWLTSIKQISDIQIPRCYHERFLAGTRVELHIFADASESAMAAVGYFRIEAAGAVVVRLILSKTRCAPLKYVSIPRLELQAAVIAVRMKQLVVENHDASISQTYFWTDSTTVVSWVRSDSRQYKQFVANRISEILEYSQPEDWRWLPGQCNVADEGTRANYDNSRTTNRWVDGPDFLQGPASDWPAQPERFEPTQGSEEKKASKRAMAAWVVEDLIDISHISKLLILVGAVARVLRIIDKCKKRPVCSLKYVTVDELRAAEILLHKLVQRSAFGEDYEALLAGKPVKKTSSLVQLNPFVDDKGVIRLSGRIEKATFLPLEERRPVILPKDHAFTELVVRHYHEKCHHINRAVIIAEIRHKYWIPSIRALVKKCESKCKTCMVRKATPKQPIMGLLPADRVTPYVRPFTYTGLDYFGPVMVSIGRRLEKKWVALFTCLTIRVVHLELAADCSSDACLLCIRNFVNRRGVPEQIRSDNGTNFQGINKELKGVDDLTDNEKIEKQLAGLGIRWVFNCQADPSDGGAWERLVQSVKKALNMILKEKAPKMETLISALIEAENIVNSRPLTHLPVESDAEEPLTPNHFLLNTANSTQTPSEVGPRQMCTRKQWKIAQALKNSFWKRWIAEYLPDLTRRTKWCQDTAGLEVNDLVLVCDAALPRSAWRRGRVLELYTGADGVHRSALIKTQTGTLKRPVSKLAKLDVVNPDEIHGGGDVGAKTSLCRLSRSNGSRHGFDAVKN